MPGYRECLFGNQRQVQLANALATLIEFCVDVRLIDISRMNVRTDRELLQFLEPARRRICHSNKVNLFTHNRTSHETLPAL